MKPSALLCLFQYKNSLEDLKQCLTCSDEVRVLPDLPDIKTFKCHQEVTEPDREGFIQSTQLGYGNGTCSLVFRGEQRDVIIINMDTLILR